MEKFTKVQENCKDSISRGKLNFRKSPKDRLSVPYVETRLENLERQWNSFNETHTEILSEISDEEFKKSNYNKNAVYDVTEELYIDYKTDLKEALYKLKCSKVSDNSRTRCDNSNVSVKLPKLSIPVYSGRYLEWQSFHDLFVSLVHNNSGLDDVQKLNYLKSHLAGEAEQLLRHIPITQENYALCWNQLKSRYDNKKYLTNQILTRLMSQKVLNVESSNSIKELLDTMNESLSALQNIGIDITTWDIIIIYIMSHKLDPESRKQWESKANESDELPTLSIFRKFLEHKFRSLEFLDTKVKPKGNSNNKQNVFHVNNSGNSNTISSMSSNLNCKFCKGNHKIMNCKQFAKEDYETRHNFVQTNRLCFNCLGTSHSVYACRQSTRCRICKRKHHSLLHPKAVLQSVNESQPVDNVALSVATTLQEDTHPIVTCFSKTDSQVLLATALVRADSKTGASMTIRCLLDQGSQASFITESAVQALGLQKLANKVYVSGVGGDHGESLISKAVVYVKVKSLHDPSFTINIKAHVLNKLTTILPTKKIVVQLWSELEDKQLADPKFYVPNKVDMLLGADIYGPILLEGLIRGPSGSPIAQNTRLGWILSGPVKSENNASLNPTNKILTMHTISNESEMIKRIWELDSEPELSKAKIYTEEEQKCEDLFKATTTRDDTGRYIVKLPLRNDNPRCKNGNLKEIAANRLVQLERRLKKNVTLQEQYSKVISEYLAMGHMELVPETERNRADVVYLPHHAVVRDDKTTTQVRIVYNASEPGDNGVSLNSELMVGPKLQPDLRHIVMRWRQYPICLVADIVKMYRQIKVTESDANEFQRIFWRDEAGLVQHYRLLRVTFGTAAAPYLAVRSLQQLAHDEGCDFKAASERVLRDFYMDDLMTGCQSVEESLKLYKEMNDLMLKGGFELQKWDSNSRRFLEGINKEKALEGNNTQRERKFIGDEKETENVKKVLGISWNSTSDEFEYAVRLPELTTPVTKRKVVSDISRLFDPLGSIAPTIIRAKIFIQKLWISGIDWDQELPQQLLQEWLNYREELSKLTCFCIPRWIGTSDDNIITELHGFSDASNEAFAAVVYIRTVDKNEQVHVNLVTAKTKVAPIKQVSIPRLELCGAQLLAKLLLEVAEALNIPKQNIQAWTDSAVVLAWLSSHPSRWKTFIANRVSDIMSILDRSQWHHVRSEDNPADGASRGVKPSIYMNQIKWTEGPSWLQKKEILYSPLNTICQDTNLEERAHKVSHATAYCEVEEFTRISSLNKLTRVIATCRRFLQLTRVKIKTTFPKWLTASELQEALRICISQAQKVYLSVDITNIIKTGYVAKKSKLASLTPFIGDDGILRVGGRLQKADITADRKHPILIPRESHLAKLIVANAHERTLHGGPQLMLNHIRSKYWIIDAKNLVKFHVRKCVTCVRHSFRTNHPFMGELPTARVTVSRAFRQSGVDYAGLIAIRASKGRGHQSAKGYICLFICMTTRAVHIEAVSDMTSEGFLAAFKRFVARRGHCSDLWSDNGSNFVGAARELKALLVEESSSVAAEIADWLATNGTSWHRIPPYSPNFGGLWEAGIKSTKHHLMRVIGTSTLTYEELSTVLSQIEACLNSRPLSQISDNSQDPFPLSPGHFLVGEPLVLVPDANYEESNVSSLKRWQYTQRMVQCFWRRWSQEYLTQFLQRYKWNRLTAEPNIGDVVLVKEDGLPPARWLYGVVVNKHTGTDQVTRVVSLRCKDTVIKRPVSKLCVLPICD